MTRRFLSAIGLSLLLAAPVFAQATVQVDVIPRRPVLPSGCTNGQGATYNTTTQVWDCATITAAPGGSDTQVQFNDGGVFGGDAGLVYNKTTDVLTLSAAALAATSTDGAVLQNTTAATAGVPVQQSPRLRLRGTAWDTAASKTLDWFVENLPATAATPTSTLKFGHSLNGAAATYPFTVMSDGQIQGTRFYATATSVDFGYNNINLFRWSNTPGVIGYISGSEESYLAGSRFSLGVITVLSWTTGGATGTRDLGLARNAAGIVEINNGTAGTFRDLKLRASTHVTANAGTWEHGQISELITLSTSGATTDSTADLLPANAIIESVVARVTTTITTATDWQLGDATIAGRFSAPNATLTAGTTQVGTVHVDQTGTSGPRQVAAAKLRITTTGTPGAGVIRVTVFFRQFAPPTS